MYGRGGRKTKKLDSELAQCFFPLFCVSGVTKKNLSFLPLIFHPPLAPYIIHRKFQKIQRKILKVSILKFWGVKLIKKLFNGIGLHSWGTDAFFDTHIAISTDCECRVPNASFMSKMPKMPYLTPMPSDMCHIIYGKMGVKRYIRTSGMQNNAIRHDLNRFDGSKL